MIIRTEGQKKNLSDEGDENNEQFNITEIQRGECSHSVLNRGKEGQEENCQSSTGRAEKGTKKRGKGRKRRRNW
jgi:hypothetical protein